MQSVELLIPPATSRAEVGVLKIPTLPEGSMTIAGLYDATAPAAVLAWDVRSVTNPVLGVRSTYELHPVAIVRLLAPLKYVFKQTCG